MAVFADVVVLAEDFFALARVGDGGVFEGCVGDGVEEGDLEDCEAVWFEDAVDFTHGLDVVADVFEDVVAEDDVECVLGEWYLVDIHFYFGEGGFDVGGYVFVAVDFFESVYEAGFGGDVEDVKFCFEEVGFFLEV